jgi:phenylalanyl-tRNA synthetase alpha chain
VNKTIEQIKEDALKELEAASETKKINDLSVKYLGRKGAVTQFLRTIASLPEGKRAEAGKKTNKIKKSLDKAFKEALIRIETRSAAIEEL